MMFYSILNNLFTPILVINWDLDIQGNFLFGFCISNFYSSTPLIFCIFQFSAINLVILLFVILYQDGNHNFWLLLFVSNCCFSFIQMQVSFFYKNCFVLCLIRVTLIYNVYLLHQKCYFYTILVFIYLHLAFFRFVNFDLLGSYDMEIRYNNLFSNHARKEWVARFAFCSMFYF